MNNQTVSAPRALVSNLHKLAMFWSPKAGCSTVAKIFLTYIEIYNNTINIIEQRDSYVKNLLNKYCIDSDPNQPIEDNIRKLLCDQDPVFYKDYLRLQVVRNPYSRVIASFLKYLEINIPKQLTFEEYLLKIKKESRFEHHMLKQFMTNELDDILYLENLESDIHRINQKYNIALPYLSYELESYSIYRNTDINFYYGDINLGFCKNHIPYCILNNNIIYGIPYYQYFYNDKSQKLVSEIYSKDLEYFKYKFPYNSKGHVNELDNNILLS